jgi:tetraacyldisaccharide-1-P 4'-kinase
VELISLEDGAQHGLDFLHGKEVIALCGVARPKAFIQTLVGLGATVGQSRKCPSSVGVCP